MTRAILTDPDARRPRIAFPVVSVMAPEVWDMHNHADMPSIRIGFLGPLAVTVLAGLACSRAPGATDDGGTTDLGQEDTVTNDTATSDATDGGDRDRICNGASEIRLALRIEGGGPAAPGTVMLSENGWRLLLVDGACTAWVLSSDNDPLGRAMLGPSEEQQLAESLQLSEWTTINPPTAGGCPDTPSANYRFGDARKSGPTCGVDATSAWGQLNAAVAAAINDIAAKATPWTGDVRYLVLRDDGSAGIDNRPPVTWPLATSIETIALTTQQAFNYHPGESLLATGDDAAKLRAIRTTTASGTAFDYTPIADATGNRYHLYIRDALPQEQPNGLLPPDTF